MSYYSLDEMEVEEGDIVQSAIGTQYLVIDRDHIKNLISGRTYSVRPSTKIFILVDSSKRQKKKGYAKWISEKEAV